MQIRLTVLAPRSGRSASETRSCDVLVTAPAGAALATVASGLATAAAGPDGPGSGSVVLYAGGHRLDLQRAALGEPPLVDGAVLSLQVPADEDDRGDGSATQLHVVAGPDAGGVHLLHGGQIRIGRSADADVPLDDPDVSRMHCTVTVEQDGRVTVTDLGSTNGTTLDGAGVGDTPVRMTPGSLLRVGESALRITTAADGSLGGGSLSAGRPGSGAQSGGAGGIAAVPDGEGHLRVARDGAAREAAPGTGIGTGPARGGPAVGTSGGHGAAAAAHGAGAETGHGTTGRGTGAAPYVSVPAQATGPTGARTAGPGSGPTPSGAGPTHSTGPAHSPGARPGTAAPADARIPEQGGGPGSRRVSAVGAQRPHDPYSNLHDEAAAAYAQDPGFASRGRQGTPPRGTRLRSDRGAEPHERTPDAFDSGHTRGTGSYGADGADATTTRSSGGPSGQGFEDPSGTDDSARRRGGIGAWARRLAGGRPDAVRDRPAAQPAEPSGADAPQDVAAVPGADTWPDPAALLLTALGPGPRLWERTPGHREALVIRLGTADRTGPGGVGVVPAVPVTVSLREAGSLGLAGPRARLAGLARSAVAQLAALHPPTDLEIVLVSTDRARPLEARRSDWGWLGWLPHVRPAHGQDCRLLLAYDRDQAAARTGELVRRLDDSPLGTGWASADPGAVSAAAERYDGPRTLLIVDGDPGSAALRETTARLASAGAVCGVHVLCLAETAPASPASPLETTYEAACAASLAFRECGAAALLSGDVATALRLLRTARGIHPAGGQSASRGTFAVVDAVSAAWAERFGRALAPLRADASVAGTPARQAAALPASSRLLDELGLARATPASLMARWAAAAETTAVLGAGPRGPVTVDLATEGPHLLIEGPAGSGRTELLRATAASLAAAARPDRLGLILVDGAGGERGEGLRACTELPHTSTYLVASDPVRMREFAQALGGELKRRAELLGAAGTFADWHRTREVAERLVGRRQPGTAEQSGDIESPTSGTLRLRPAGARTDPMPGPTPLPRLVVIVDDFDALVAPALGSPGRPTAGSVVRALEAVARDGERLGVHLIAASARPDRTADTELARISRLRVVLDAPPASPGPDSPAPGRGRLGRPDRGVTPFQGGRVTGRIPRTATLRPTVIPLEWERMGDPPARRPVRELGNGPTDLALLASALERAARSVDAMSIPSLTA
ncbi:FHA domain-containing protein [Streptomyces sp. NBC_01089]|uniref:FHA domain-containing protein n=1 Tax=Streptomyces sp. NBC_01089 TaxID=2903747 RepID=UPI00386DDC72|nr:FHA domain-containing protein [Streptomyces sp. NBC_01089]